MLLRLSFVLSLCAFSTQAMAQSCDAIINHGLRNIEISQSSETVISLTYFNHCEGKSDSYSGQTLANAEVEVFGSWNGGAGYSDQQRRDLIHNWCETNKATAYSNREHYQEARTIYQGAVSAWSACNALLYQQMYIDPVISPDARSVDLAIAYRGGGEGVQLYGIASENFTCTSQFPSAVDSEVSYPLIVQGQAVQVSCKRTPAFIRTIEGVEYDVLPRGTITVQTAQSPFQLFFPEEYDPPAPLAAVAQLQLTIDQLKDQLASVQKENTRIDQRMMSWATRADLVAVAAKTELSFNNSSCAGEDLNGATRRCRLSIAGQVPEGQIVQADIGSIIGEGNAELVVTLLEYSRDYVDLYLSRPWRGDLGDGRIVVTINMMVAVARP